jgi:hypothetical protein
LADRGYDSVVPITYDRDDDRRLIIATATEPYTADDILAVIDRQAAEDTWGYATVYDWRAVTHVPTDHEVHQAADRVKIVGGGRERGPVGIIAIGAHAKPLLGIGLAYGTLTNKLVPVEVLFTTAQLDDWLTRNARRTPHT